MLLSKLAVFQAFWQTFAHKARRGMGSDHYSVVSDVIAVRVRNEGERARLLGIEPEIVRRKFYPVRVVDLDLHEKRLG